MEAALDLASPFAALVSPSDVIEAVERSATLRSLSSRVHRPLDKPLIAHRKLEDEPSPFSVDVLDFDAAVDAELDEDFTEWDEEVSALVRGDELEAALA